MTTDATIVKGYTAWGTPCYRAENESEWHDMDGKTVPGHERESIAQRVRCEVKELWLPLGHQKPAV